MAASGSQTSGHALPVDAQGGPTIDPTENVKALSESQAKRNDDLREINNQLLDTKIAAIKELAQLRADHAREIRILETDRLEKIRQVDVSNTAITAAQQLAAIQTLAATAASNADALRTAVATTATTIQNQTDRVVGGIVDRIAVLEKSSYTGAGRAGVADPQMERLSAMVEGLAKAQSQSTGKSEGLSVAWAVVVGVAGLIATIITIAAVFLSTK